MNAKCACPWCSKDAESGCASVMGLPTCQEHSADSVLEAIATFFVDVAKAPEQPTPRTDIVMARAKGHLSWQKLSYDLEDLARQLERSLGVVHLGAPVHVRLDLLRYGTLVPYDVKELAEWAQNTVKHINELLASRAGEESEPKWNDDDPRRIFVEGAKWWQYHAHGSTASPSEVDVMEAEAFRRYAEEKK